MKDRYIQSIIFLVLIVVSLVFMAACGNDDDDNLDERGIALRDDSKTYGQSLQTQMSQTLRPRLLGKANTLALIEDLESDEAFAEIESTLDLEGIEDHIKEVAIVGSDGIVLQSTPVDYSGSDWSGREIITHVTTNQVPSISVVETAEDNNHHFQYVFPLMEGSVFRGMLWTDCITDSVIQRSVGYIISNDTTDVDAFIMESNTRIIYDSNPAYFGVNLIDSDIISHNELAQSILDEDSGSYLDYNDEGPGSRHNSGSRIVGWSRLLLEDIEWIIVLTEPR